VRLERGAALHIRTLKSVDLDIGASCRIDIDPTAITVWPATSESAPSQLGRQ
jgi:hypothetical protein